MKHQEDIIAIVRQILQHLGVECLDINTEVDEKTGSARFVISTNESALLIGEHGARLSALNHVVKKIMEHRLKDEQLNFTVDVNNYHKKHIDDLRSKAHILAERARYFKSSVEMDPMSAYERMIVHAEFTNTPDIETSSTGVGKNRHIILKYTERAKEDVL